MSRGYTLIDCQRQEAAVIVQLRHPRLDENQLSTLAEEVLQASREDGCRKLILRFGPRPVECLYSVFLAKLISLQRQLAERQTGLILSEVAPAMFSIFRACRLEEFFLFAETLEQALALVLPDSLPLPSQLPCQKAGCHEFGLKDPVE